MTMKYIFLSLLLFLQVFAYSQSFMFPAWEKDEVTFKTVSIKFEDNSKKKILFDGYKDAFVSIKQHVVSDGKSGELFVSGQISGYLKFESVKITDLKVEQNSRYVSYQITGMYNGSVISIGIQYEAFGEPKPTSIVVVYIEEKKNSLVFTLTGFE